MLPQAAEYEMASTPSLFCSEMHIEGDLNLTDNNVQESKELSRLLWKFFVPLLPFGSIMFLPQGV